MKLEPKKILPSAGLAAFPLLALPMVAMAETRVEPAGQLLAENGCSAAARTSILDHMRGGIEAAVGRQEAILEFPDAVDRLACLDQLAAIDLDFAVPIPDLSAVLNSALDELAEGVCAFALDKWEDATEPLYRTEAVVNDRLAGVYNLGIPGVNRGTVPQTTVSVTSDFNPGTTGVPIYGEENARRAPDASRRNNDFFGNLIR